MTDSARPRRLWWLASFRFQLALILGLLGALFFVNATITFAYLTQHEADGRVINIAGRQRMLLEQIAFEAHVLDHDPDEARQAIAATAQEFEASLSDLRDRNSARGLPPAPPHIKSALDGVAADWASARARIDVILAASAGSQELASAIEELTAAIPGLIAGSDRVVQQYEDAFAAKVQRVQIATIVLAVIGGLSAFSGWWFALRPFLGHLGRLAEGAARFGRGELGHHVTIASEWKRRIGEALEQNRFVLHCQRIVDLRTRDVHAYELLLRMKDERGGLLAPSAFLDVAERFGLIGNIDLWVVRQALRLIADQAARGRILRLAVNLSARVLTDDRLLQALRREIATSDADPSNLCLEITETAAISDIRRAQEFVSALREMGCRFALDDFGSGFSSFYQLKNLPVDIVKIDSGFIRHLDQSPSDQHIVRAIVEVAHGLGKRTVAESIENAETVRILSRLGVDYGQGYHLGMPVPICVGLPCDGGDGGRELEAEAMPEGVEAA